MGHEYQTNLAVTLLPVEANLAVTLLPVEANLAVTTTEFTHNYSIFVDTCQVIVFRIFTIISINFVLTILCVYILYNNHGDIQENNTLMLAMLSDIVVCNIIVSLQHASLYFFLNKVMMALMSADTEPIKRGSHPYQQVIITFYSV